MRHYVIDAAAPHDPVEAFIVCHQNWQETAQASGLNVLAWGPSAWTDGDLWCFSAAGVRAKRPGCFDFSTLYGVLATAQSKGYAGPEDLAHVASWCGIDWSQFFINTPLGRCRLMAAVMRAPRITHP